MRVALISLSIRGAMGQYVEALAQALSQKTELHLFVPVHFNGAECGAAITHRFVTGDSRLRALARLLNPVGALAVWQQIRTVRPDIVHLFNGEGYPWALLWARWAARDGLPFVVTLHDPDPHPGNLWEWLNAQLRRHVLVRARSVHVHAQCFVEVARAQGARMVKVIPHGSLAQRYLRYKQEGIVREPLVLFFGRIQAYKGLDLLIEAASYLTKGMRVVIAGPGKLSSKLLSHIRSRPDQFELHNYYLPDHEVTRLFQRASVCVLPYRQATQSSVPLIAAAFGVPVVATAVGAFVEDVPRVGGILVHPNDPRSLARAITEAIGRTPTYPQELEFCHIFEHFVKWYGLYGQS